MAINRDSMDNLLEDTRFYCNGNWCDEFCRFNIPITIDNSRCLLHLVSCAIDKINEEEGVK